MRKIQCIIMLLAFLITGATAVLAASDTKIDIYDQKKQEIKSIVFAIGINQYFINGKTPGVKMDAAPYEESGRTFVPVRFLGNALGITDDNIKWLPCCDTARLISTDTTVEMKIGDKKITTNGREKGIDVSPQLKDPGRTFLPARFVCEALGYEVDWQNDKYVLVWPKGQPRPDIEQLKKQIEQKENNLESNGYNVPKTTDMKVVTEGQKYGVELSVLIRLYKPLDKQYEDLFNILGSKFESDTVNEVLVYIKGKTDWKQQLSLKKFAINNYDIEVISPAGDETINVLVRKPE